MGTNDDFYDKEFNLNCFYMPSNFEQKYPKTAIVISRSNQLLWLSIPCMGITSVVAFPNWIFTFVLKNVTGAFNVYVDEKR